MKSNSQGLQDSFRRAFNAIVRANLLQMLGAPNATSSTTTWGYVPAAGMSLATIQNAINSAISEAQNAVLSQSFLQLEQPLTTGSNSIIFPILDNSGTANNAQSPTERRLTQQDSFFTSALGFYITLKASATDTSWRPQTFPNVNIFLTGAAGLETVSPLNCVYNGILAITINKNEIIPAYPVSDFLQVPQTQRLTTTPANQSNQLDPTERALLEPNWNFIGSKSNSIKLILPANLSAVDANTYAVIRLYGTLGQNTTILT